MSEIIRKQENILPLSHAASANRIGQAVEASPVELQTACARHPERDARREMMQAETKATKSLLPAGEGIAQRPGPIQYSKSVAESFSMHSSQLLNSA